MLLGAALGVSACDKVGAEGELGRHVAVTTGYAKAQVESARLQEETRRKEQAVREAMAQGYSREERDRLQAELARLRSPAAVYGAPPPRTTSSVKKPCGCVVGDPLCSCD